MKALQFYGINDYALKDIPVPVIGKDEILLKVKAAAICGSDLRMIQNGYKDVSHENPRIYGHEIAGIIEETGEDVTGYKKGMTVAIAPNMGCGVCDACVSGNTHLCREYRAFGINMDGGFAEYMVIPKAAIIQGNIVPITIDEHMTFEKAAVLEPLSCVYNGFEQVGIRPCDTVLVIGAGPIGIMHAMLAKMTGAAKVIITDLNEARVKICQEFDPFFMTYVGDDLQKFVMEQTNGEGVSVCITACPSPQAQAQALDLLAMNGRVNFFGGLPAGKSKVTIDTNQVHYKQLVLTGSCRASLTQYRKCLKLVQNGVLNIDKLVSATYPLEDYEKAIQAAKEGKNLKNIFVFD